MVKYWLLFHSKVPCRCRCKWCQSSSVFFTSFSNASCSISCGTIVVRCVEKRQVMKVMSVSYIKGRTHQKSRLHSSDSHCFKNACICQQHSISAYNEILFWHPSEIYKYLIMAHCSAGGAADGTLTTTTSTDFSSLVYCP